MQKPEAGQGRSGTLVLGVASLVLVVHHVVLRHCALCQGVGTWPEGAHHLVSSPSLFPTLLSDTLLAWLAVWAQVRPTHVPSSPAPYQCAYKLKWPCSMGTSVEAEISVELPSYQR